MAKKKEYWTKKDGTKIDVDEMDIRHLRNTLKMIIRANREARKKYRVNVLKDSFIVHGEMAQASIEDNMDDERNDDTEPYAFDHEWK